jgi:hypothetical protein
MAAPGGRPICLGDSVGEQVLHLGGVTLAAIDLNHLVRVQQTRPNRVTWIRSPFTSGWGTMIRTLDLAKSEVFG